MSLIYIACVVIILAGLKAASSVIVPFLLAIFIAIVISPAMLYMQKLKIGRLFSFLIVTVLFLSILGFLGNIIFNTIAEFTANLPELQNRFRGITNNFIQKANSYEFINIDESMIGLDVGMIVNQFTTILKKTGFIISKGFFIFMMVAFIVFESSVMEEKIKYLSKINRKNAVFFNNFIKNLKKYLLIKTIASIATGITIGFLLWIAGVPYAPLWGILAFILNYIPTIGSIIAVLPTLFVTLSSMSLGVSVWVILIYLFVNVLIGNIIEPRFMGQGLGISTFVVLVSLLLWGFVFGIGGLFLAIPLTMSIKIALKSNPDTRFLSVMLSNKVSQSV